MADIDTTTVAPHDPALIDATAEHAARLYWDYGHVWDREDDGTWKYEGGVAREMRRRQREAARTLLTIIDTHRTPACPHRFPDGRPCGLSPEAHQSPGVSEHHGYPGSTQ